MPRRRGCPTRATPGGVLRRQLIGASDGPPGISSVMVEAFNIIQDRIARSRLAGDPPDLTIGPKLGRIGNCDVHRATEAIDIGCEAARKMTAEITANLTTSPESAPHAVAI